MASRKRVKRERANARGSNKRAELLIPGSDAGVAGGESESSGKPKPKLSQNLKSLAFMKRKAETVAERDAASARRKRQRDERWVLPPALQERGRGLQVRRALDSDALVGLGLGVSGRISLRSFNADVAKTNSDLKALSEGRETEPGPSSEARASQSPKSGYAGLSGRHRPQRRPR